MHVVGRKAIVHQLEEANHLADAVATLLGKHNTRVVVARMVKAQKVIIVSEDHAAGSVDVGQLQIIGRILKARFGSRSNVDATPPQPTRNGIRNVLVKMKANHAAKASRLAGLDRFEP
jgi:hypothetical protein